jgi:hypothetical protein
MDTSITHRSWRPHRTMVILALVATVATACFAAPANATVAPSQTHRHNAAAGPPWSTIIKQVVKHGPGVATTIYKWLHKRHDKPGTHKPLTQQQVDFRYCGGVYRYFHNSLRVWAWYAVRYQGSNFAWRYCSSVGYL